MAQINISDELHAQLSAFKPVLESLLDVSLEFDGMVEMLLKLSPDAILSDVFGNAEPRALLIAIEQLGQQHPAEVYGYIKQMLDQGHHVVEERQREEVKRRLGFREPNE